MTTIVLLIFFFVSTASAENVNDTLSDNSNNVMINNQDVLTDTSSDNTDMITTDKNVKTESNQTKIKPEITVANKTAKCNTSVILEAQLPEDASGKVLFKINGLTIGDAFKTNGGHVTYDYNIPLYSSRNYTITFVYGGNSIYESARVDGILTLTKLQTKATIKSNRSTVAQGENIRFDVNIKNELDSGIVDAFVIKINGQSIGVNKTDSNGKGYLYYTIPNVYKINNYTVDLVYGDTNTAIGNRINTTLKVDNPTKITLYYVPTTKTHGTLKLKSKVVDKLRNNVTSGEVVYKINGITMGRASVKNGTAEFEYQLPLYAPRNYTITALYGANKYYQPSSVNRSLTLIKANTKLSTEDRTLRVGKVNSFDVNVLDEFNKTVDNAVVKLIVNDKIVSRYQVVNGIAHINYTLNNIDSSKQPTASIIFDGNKFYENSSLNLNCINPTTITLDDIKFNSTTGLILLNATVKDGLNKSVNRSNVEFKLDDKGLFNITVHDGVSKTSYRLPIIESGKHNITAIYHGNYYYQESNITKYFNTDLLNVTINVKNNTLQVNKKNQLNLTVRNQYYKNVTDGSVRLLINNKEVGKYNLSNQPTIITYTLNNIDSTKHINASIVYDANKYYNKAVLNLNVINPTKITLNSADTKTTKLLYINATVTDAFNKNVSNGKVYFYINHKYITNDTVKNGVIKTSYRLGLLKGGKYNITAKYIGDQYYQNSNITKTVNIQKLNTKITPVDVNFTVSSSNISSINVTDELNNPVKNGIISLYVNNQNMGNFSVKNGSSKILFKSPTNTSNTVINYKLQYNSNDYYTTSQTNGKMNIKPLTIVYVSPDGNDKNLGDSKNPYKTIKYAASHVKEGGLIYIKPGEYNEANININQSLNIFGLNSSDKVIIKPIQNGYVFNNNNISSNLTLVNITIKNAKINTANTSAVTSKGPLTVVNCKFENNQATVPNSSASIYATNYLAISSTDFNNNTAKSNGGAVTALGHKVIILASKFTNNTVNANNVGGAAIYLNSANSTIESTLFTHNMVNGVNVTGGAIKKVSGNLTLNRVNIAYNKLTGSGYNIGGGVINLNGYMYIVNSTINSNNVTSTNNCGAAAFYSQNSFTAIYTSTITNNIATGKNVYGAAVQNFNTYLSVSNTNFTYNTAKATNGQAVGGAINQNNGTVIIENSRFHKNTATATDAYAGALYFVGTRLNITKTQFNQNIATGTSVGAAGALFANSNSTITKSNFTSNQALGKSNGGGAIINALNLTAENNNFISNVAKATGSAISNSGKNININNNYWGTRSPSWSKLLRGVNKPSKYSTKAL